jgi:HAD superfamily hydrolase (TIGR01509 family)
MKLQLPKGTFRAYLFDCDGTIADSMPLHYNAWRAVLADWKCEYPEEVFYSWGGKPVRKIIEDLNKINGLQMPIEELATRKEGLYLAQVPQLKVIPEVLEHIEAEHGRIPLAVVSGSTRDSVVGSLSVLGLLDKFETIVSAEDYKHGKPAPDCYLLAAERLGVAPADCLVFEDTEMGIEAATAAGMASVKIATSLERRRLNGNQ